jgi:glucan endo-1,3-alpha-glucosidase
MLVRKEVLLLWLGLTLLVPLRAAGQTNVTVPHFVFAHYMVCYPDYGESLKGYKRDIQDAQAAGIDGFALNMGAYDNVQKYYKTRVGLLFRAAEQLGTGFKLFFSVDFSGESNVVQMVEDFGNRPAMFRYQGKIVLSSYGKNDVPSVGWPGMDWTNAILGKLKTNGFPVFFIPYFFADHELPNYTDATNLLTKYGDILDGLFLWGAAGLPSELATCNSNYTRAVHAAGKPFMASISPHYWGNAQKTIGRRYYETDGGEGLLLQWQSIIANQPDWVEICTWNDFNESTYISPIEDPGAHFSGIQVPRRYSHKGYLEFSKRYIQWYKSGTDPGCTNDALFCFYRIHPKDLVASNTNDVPVTWRFGDLSDSVCLSAFLLAPAQLESSSGGQLRTNTLAAGLQQIRIPFAPGPQVFTLRRAGKQLASFQGPDILKNIQNYDFFPASGFAYSTPAPTPLVNLRSP